MFTILETLTQGHNGWEQVRRFDMNQEDGEIENCASTQFLHIQKKRLIELLEHWEDYWNVSPVFGFNSAKYDLNLNNSYWLPIFVNDRGNGRTGLKTSEPTHLVQI